METQATGQRGSNPPLAEPKAATIAERANRLLRRRSSAATIEPASRDALSEQRLKACEARIDHLEAALEGLQDALYRHEVREKDSIDELQRRTDPEQMARDLSQDARRRGL
jgi:hypothetical protein